MAQEVSFDTPIDDNFNITDEILKFVADNMRHNSLSLNHPVLCGEAFFKSRFIGINPLFFSRTCYWLVHFELNKTVGYWQWQIHFEFLKMVSTSGGQNDETIKELSSSYAAKDLYEWWQNTYPSSQYADRFEPVKNWRGEACSFKSSQSIKTLGDAIEVFDELYTIFMELMLKEDLTQVQEKYPFAADCFKMANLMCKVKRVRN